MEQGFRKVRLQDIYTRLDPQRVVIQGSETHPPGLGGISCSLTQQLGVDKSLVRRLQLCSLGGGKGRQVMRMERACGKSRWALRAMEGCRLASQGWQVTMGWGVCSGACSERGLTNHILMAAENTEESNQRHKVHCWGREGAWVFMMDE